MIKNTKKLCICEYAIFSIDTFKKCFLGLKKGISELLQQIAAKHTADGWKVFGTGADLWWQN